MSALERLESAEAARRLLAEARAGAGRPFAEDRRALLAALSRALLTRPDTRRRGDLVALGYWLRPANLDRLRRNHAPGPGRLRAARGLVLHLPPANVPTLAVYGWALALLGGNATVVRVSERALAAEPALFATVAEVLAAAPPVLRRGQRFVRTGHDPAVMAALAAGADARLAWGGDAAVAELRRHRLPPHALDLGFPDRWSLSLLDADAWRDADAPTREAVVEALLRDAGPFDQRACASPRLVAWLGDPGETAEALWGGLARRLAAEAPVPAGLAMERLHFAYRAALDAPISRAHAPEGRVIALRIDDLARLSRDHPGGGLFFEAVLPDPEPLLRFLRPTDQALGWWGLDADALAALAPRLADAGLDRIVRLGHALDFDAAWDGVDLLDALTRAVVVEAP